MSKETLIKKYFDFFENDLLQTIKSSGLAHQKEDGWQGLTSHTRGVVFRSIDYALSLNQNPLPVIFSAALHDIAKTKSSEFGHALKALPIAKKIMRYYSDTLSEDYQKSILTAIANHTDGKNPTDYICACLWDADRTRIAWVLGYQEEFFHTKRAKEVASSLPEDYLAYQAKCLSCPFEDRELILEYRTKFRHFRYKQLIQILKTNLSERQK